MLSNIYEGTNQKIDTTDIANNLNTNIEKSGIKNSQNENSIKQFVAHICEEYTNTLVHTKYENKINDIYNKALETVNNIFENAIMIFAIDLIAIIIINNKKISKNIQHIGIALVATSIFELSIWQIIISKIDINGIRIFNEVFSNSVVTIIKDMIKQIVSLSLGTMFIGIIFTCVYTLVVSIKTSNNKKETKVNEN